MTRKQRIRRYNQRRHHVVTATERKMTKAREAFLAMTREQLREVASTRGVKFTTRTTKDALVEALVAA